MKKILYLITQSEFGGAQKYVFDLATNLPPYQFAAVVAAGEQGDGELFERLADFLRVKTIKLKRLKRLPSIFNAFSALKEIEKMLLAEKPDALHLNSTTAGVLGSWAAQRYKKKTDLALKVIYTAHGWAFLEPGFLKQKIYLLAEKITAKHKDIFIVLSEKDKQAALKYKIASQEKIKKIYNGIDQNSLRFLKKSEAQKAIGLSPVLGVIANLYATKGLNYLVEAVHLLKRKNDNITLAIVGEGQERKKLEQQIAKYGLKENVWLLGRLPNVSQYLKTFDIFVLASVKEGFPFVILEAMSAGLPIIATTVGAIPEILENEKSALLVEPKNPQALAQAITKLLDNPEKQKNLAQSAKQKAENFSLRKTLSQTYSLY